MPDQRPPPPVDAPSGPLTEVLAGLRLGPGDAVAVALLAAAAVAGLGLLWFLARPGPATSAGGAAPPSAPAFELPSQQPGPTPGPSELVVHVAGLVAAPGVHRLPAGARVGDALAAAGGAAGGAALDGLNLARPLVDGEQIVVGAPAAGPPAAGPTAAGTGPGSGPAAGGAAEGAVRPDGRLDLNLATLEDLDELPGVGPVLAERIVSHRESIGRFSEVGELRDVSGIGEKTFQDLAELVTV
jgi:competence protein ComEA